jgi:hypothetical protein
MSAIVCACNLACFHCPALERDVQQKGCDDKFISLWRYYLMYCEDGFRGGGINAARVTLIKELTSGGAR